MAPLRTLLISMHIDLIVEGVQLGISDEKLAECWDELMLFMERVGE